jgi:ABC-type sugar transport system permease subunit
MALVEGREARTRSARILGWIALTFVASLVLVVYVIPSRLTVVRSFQDWSPYREEQPSVGFAQYSRLFNEHELAAGWATVWSMIGLSLVVTVVLAPAAAWLCHRGV